MRALHTRAMQQRTYMSLAFVYLFILNRTNNVSSIDAVLLIYNYGTSPLFPFSIGDCMVKSDFVRT